MAVYSFRSFDSFFLRQSCRGFFQIDEGNAALSGDLPDRLRVFPVRRNKPSAFVEPAPDHRRQQDRLCTLFPGGFYKETKVILIGPNAGA